MSLIAPGEAKRRMLAATAPLMDTETLPLFKAHGRTLAADLVARRTQPPFTASAMDGYAVKAADLAEGRPLRVIGEASAGHPFSGAIAAGEALRIFTGAVVPAGADTILIQENAEIDADGRVLARQTEPVGRFIRPAGLDFHEGDRLLRAGMTLTPPRLALAASMGHAALPVWRRPRVAVLSTGDELVAPGAPLKPGQIVSSNTYAVAALIEAAGGEAIDHGIVPDDAAATEAAITEASASADLLVTCGGASVGDHDFVQAALKRTGFAIEFWRVAIRPGKPLMFGVRGGRPCLGLPGNPVSSYMCALLFLQPLIRRLLGDPAAGEDPRETALLTVPVPANDLREEYMRAQLAHDPSGGLGVTPFALQDSSVQRIMAEADALIVRPPHAPALPAGAPVPIIRLTSGR
jgi:molybdopterin molybdotransferase